MKIVAALLSLHITSAAHGGEFARRARFDSVAGFVAAAKAFEPAKAKGDLAEWFGAREVDELENDKPAVARGIKVVEELWADDTDALVFVTAEPPTEGTRSVTAVLFLLVREKGLWRISDTRRFAAAGKYAGASAELTAGVGTGYKLGREGMAPVITIETSHGGRGYGYQISASYTFDTLKLKRLDLE